MKIISEEKEIHTFFYMKKVDRPPLVLGEMLTEIKFMLGKLCISRAVVTQTAVGKCVLIARGPEINV